MAGERPLKAVQAGGPSAGCLPASALDLRIDAEDRPGETVSMGTGGIIVLDDTACMVDMARFLLDFFVEESCGKCVPCREGTKQMLRILTRICHGQGTADDLALLERLAKHVKLASLCGLGAVAPDPVLAALRYFRDEFESHIRDKKCPAGVCRDMAGAAEQRERRVCSMSTTASDRVTITIDGRTTEVARGTTILNAARQMGITIPTLCNFRGLPPYAACRVCLVELETPRGPRYVASCSHPAEDRRGGPYRYRAGAAVAADGARIDAGPGPRVARAGRVRREARRAIHPVRAGGRRRVHPLRAVRSRVRPVDGPRRRQHGRPRRRAQGRPGLRRADRPVPGVRGVRVRLSHRRPGTRRHHGPAAAAAPDRARSVPRGRGRTSTWPIRRPRRACR